MLMQTWWLACCHKGQETTFYAEVHKREHVTTDYTVYLGPEQRVQVCPPSWKCEQDAALELERRLREQH